MSILRRLFQRKPVQIEVPKTNWQPVVKAQQDLIEALRTEVNQLRFLLESAPMIDAPTSGPAFIAAIRSPFAYIHPKTLAKFATGANVQKAWLNFPGSPTKWISTSFMPEGRVIYSPLPMPGLENRLIESRKRLAD